MSDQVSSARAEGQAALLRLPFLAVLAVAGFVLPNSIAVPYVRKNGIASAKDFFTGENFKGPVGKFITTDLLLVVVSFHLWAFIEARRLGILWAWVASFALTWTVAIGDAVPFFLLARDVELVRRGRRE